MELQSFIDKNSNYIEEYFYTWILLILRYFGNDTRPRGLESTSQIQEHQKNVQQTGHE